MSRELRRRGSCGITRWMLRLHFESRYDSTDVTAKVVGSDALLGRFSFLEYRASNLKLRVLREIELHETIANALLVRLHLMKAKLPKQANCFLAPIRFQTQTLPTSRQNVVGETAWAGHPLLHRVS